MANYNTFLVIDCKARKPVLVTSSARKARNEFRKGRRVEVWNDNIILETIRYTDLRKEKDPLLPYLKKEMEYIGQKQKRAEARNKEKVRRLYDKYIPNNS